MKAALGVMGSNVVLGTLAVVLGGGGATLNSVGWYYAQHSLSVLGRPALLGLVTQFYLAQGFAMISLVLGLCLFYRALVGGNPGSGQSVRAVLSAALASKKALQAGAVAAVTYAVAYALVSGVLVYQPGVDFGAAYGVTSTSWNVAACCGSLGTVPSLVLYLVPQLGFAVQVVPLNLLFAVLVPLLVGFNVAVATHAVRGTRVRTGGRWLSSIGVTVGLFTGCPTCAGVFLAGAVGGLGATTLAVALAPYQLLFVSVSIPLLLASPLAMATTVKKASCSVAGPVP